jgi:hypothetical protein
LSIRVSSFLAKNEMLRFAQHDKMEGHDRGWRFLASLETTEKGCHSEPSFFVALSEARGSLGAYAPQEDIPGRRPERSEGCFAKGLKILWKMLILLDKKAVF